MVALVGTRISPAPATQRQQVPYVTYQRVNDGLRQTLPAPASLIRATVQFNCWGQTWSQSRDVASAVRRALDGIQNQTVNGRCVRSCRLDETRDMQAGEDAEHGVMMDFTVFYEE